MSTLAALNDPQRRALYGFVVERGADGVTKDEAAQATGIGRSLASYHLDRLTEEGLLEASFERPEGRAGPGAGRPAKVYRRSAEEVGVSVPPRDYRLLAELLARAIEADRGGTVARALGRVARAIGAEMVAGSRPPKRASARKQVEALRAALAEAGFEPFDDEDGTLRLRNCPFHRLSRTHTDLVCGMNLDLMSGMARALGPAIRPSLEPRPDGCCVAFRTRTS